MKNTIIYDPLAIHRNGNDIARAKDNILSVRIESNLENKLQDLLKELIETDDQVLLEKINLKIKNTQMDLEDLRKTRDNNSKRLNYSDDDVTLLTQMRDDDV